MSKNAHLERVKIVLCCALLQELDAAQLFFVRVSLQAEKTESAPPQHTPQNSTQENVFEPQGREKGLPWTGLPLASSRGGLPWSVWFSALAT